MAFYATKEEVMSAIESLGFEVFYNGAFHYDSKRTTDMLINDNGSIHCWTQCVFNGKNHGDLISFIRILYPGYTFYEAQKIAYDLIGKKPQANLKINKNTNKKIIISKKPINEEIIKKFENNREKYYKNFLILLRQTLSGVCLGKQEEIARQFKIAYIKTSNKLIMPIYNEENKCVTFWKYNKNPVPYKDKNMNLIYPSKVMFSKGRKRCIFNINQLKEYRKDKTKWILLCAGEKDVLNAIGNGYRAFTLGSENISLHKKYEKFLLGMKILIIYDWDKTGKQGAIKIKKELKEIANEVKIWDWELVSKKEGINLFKGYDLTNYLEYKLKS